MTPQQLTDRLLKLRPHLEAVVSEIKALEELIQSKPKKAPKKKVN